MPADPALAEIVRKKGVTVFAEPVKLASGEVSRYFVDAKKALAHGDDLRRACEAMVAAATDAGSDFDVVGGLTMGADQFAHGVALVASKEWFVVRKEPKGRGTNKLVEGAVVAGRRALLVEDAVTTGGSIQKAFHQVVAEGAEVVMAVTLVDRGEVASTFFEEQGIAYRALLTYSDLGMPEFGTEAPPA